MHVCALAQPRKILGTYNVITVKFEIEVYQLGLLEIILKRSIRGQDMEYCFAQDPEKA